MLLFVLLSIVQGLDFGFQIKQQAIRCFTDRLGPDILVVGNITGDNTNFQLVVKIPGKSYEEGVLFEENFKRFIRFSYLTQAEDDYSICIHNNHNDTIKFTLNYNKGLDAHDFTLQARFQDLSESIETGDKIIEILDTIHKVNLMISLAGVLNTVQNRTLKKPPR